MIQPYSHTHLSLDMVQALSRRVGVVSPIEATTKIDPAVLCGSMALRDHSVVLKDRKNELSHYYLSFFVETDDVIGLLKLGDLKMLEVCEETYILTGNILEWRQLVVQALKKDTSTSVREVANYLLAYLRDNGFGSLFNEFERKSLPIDGTMVLV